MNSSQITLRETARRVQRPLVDGLFVVLLLAVIIAAGWLIARHDHYWDLTAKGSNSLSPQSLAILERVKGQLRATVFSPPDTTLGKRIGQFLARYRQLLPDMDIKFLDPQLFPERARDAEVALVGQILLEYQGRRETLKALDERAVATAILRLTENRTAWVAVIEGHGERDINGPAPSDLGRFGEELMAQGYLARPLDLSTTKDVPDNTRLVVLSGSRIAFQTAEVERLTRYLDRGGNLLWLMDPGPMNGLEPLVAQLGLDILPGVVVDAAGAKWGSDTPTLAVITDYPNDALASGLTLPALMPGAVAMAPEAAPGWTVASFLATGPKSWNEMGQVGGSIDRDEMIGERPGPMTVVLALTRAQPGSEREQRVLVTGDGDFISNAQLNNRGNRELGLKLLSWLSSEERLLELPPEPGAVEPLELSDRRRMLIGLGALVLLPGLFLGAGLIIRWLRWREG